MAKRGWGLFTHWRTMVRWKTGEVWMNGDCWFNLLIVIEKGHRRVFFGFRPRLWNTEGPIYITKWKKSLQFSIIVYITIHDFIVTAWQKPHYIMLVETWSCLLIVSHVTKNHSVFVVCGWGGLVPAPLLISSRILVTNRQTIRLVF